jgi:hypothetical protein
MDRSGPGVDWLLADLSPGVLQARLLARRLDRIVQEMGEGISEALYRRTRDAVVRGNHEFILADPDNDRVLRELLRQETPVAASGPPRPDIGLPGDPRRLREVWEDLCSSEIGTGSRRRIEISTPAAPWMVSSSEPEKRTITRGPRLTPR